MLRCSITMRALYHLWQRIPAPTRIVLAWLLLITLGAAALRLPAAGRDRPLVWIDAAFVSTSAVCVTGLSTVSIAERLSPFGQTIVLLLIQLGGLGISVVSTLLLVAAGRATLTHHLSAQESLAAVRIKPIRLLFWAISVTIVCEALGALVLALRFQGPQAVWWAAFHSISAFCNAGFSLFPDSLTGFRADPLVNLTIAALIVLGGIGFITLRQATDGLVGAARGRRHPLFLHTRVVLIASIALLALGATGFLAAEWKNTLAGLSTSEKCIAAGFQSATTRTAGFNTLDFSRMREPTLLFTMFLMFVGGAPGSCAGGIKVTTLIVVLATIRARIYGRQRVSLLARTIPPEVVGRAFYLVTLSLVFVATMAVALVISEERFPDLGVRSDRLTVLAFEVVSAFGTVGLSAGVTEALSPFGKVLIMVCMFVGRLGPLAVALAFFRPRPGPAYEYPREELAIG